MISRVLLSPECESTHLPEEDPAVEGPARKVHPCVAEAQRTQPDRRHEPLEDLLLHAKKSQWRSDGAAGERTFWKPHTFTPARPSLPPRPMMTPPVPSLPST